MWFDDFQQLATEEIIDAQVNSALREHTGAYVSPLFQTACDNRLVTPVLSSKPQTNEGT